MLCALRCAGNTVALVGLDQFITKNATLTDEKVRCARRAALCCALCCALWCALLAAACGIILTQNIGKNTNLN